MLKAVKMKRRSEMDKKLFEHITLFQTKVKAMEVPKFITSNGNIVYSFTAELRVSNFVLN